MPILILLLFLPQTTYTEEKKPIGVINITIYCLHTVAASGLKLKPGDIALSQDIEKKFGLKFGDLIYVEDEPEAYTFADRMPARWKRHADIYSKICHHAKQYGIKKRQLWFIKKDNKEN